MRLLLDTHVWLWSLVSPERLSPSAARLLGDAENDLYLSAASCWEIAIKYQLGKLPLPEHPELYRPAVAARWHTRFASVIAACDAGASPADDPP